MKISTVESLAKFIRGPLIPMLRDDAKNFKIILERDLEYRIYYHITNAINEKKFLIMGNKTISGIRTSAETRGTKSDSKRFAMPDIMIRDNDNVNEIRIILELKLDKAKFRSVYLNRTKDRKEFNADFKNLRKYWINSKLKKHLKYEFFIYLYRDDVYSEKDIEDVISKKLGYPQLIPIAINRYWNGKGWYNQPTKDEAQSQIDKEYTRLDTIDVRNNSSKKTSKKKSPGKMKASSPLTTNRRRLIAIQCYRDSKKLQDTLVSPDKREFYGLPPKGKKPRKGRR